jgi:hypothetical protein
MKRMWETRRAQESLCGVCRGNIWQDDEERKVCGSLVDDTLEYVSL